MFYLKITLLMITVQRRIQDLTLWGFESVQGLGTSILT